MPVRPALPTPRTLRARTQVRAERATTNRAVRQAIVSLAGLIGTPVRNQTGQEVGRLVDVVARLYGDERYPPVTGLVIRVGRRRAYIDANAIHAVQRRSVALRTARFDLRDYQRRPGEVLLARDVLDHQLVDVDGVQVIRAADLYLAPIGEQTVLVGVDVSIQTLPELLERLPPATHEHLLQLLGYPEDEAGGFMTTRVMTAAEHDTVADLRVHMAAWTEHRNEIDAVAVCDAEHRLMADVPLFDLLIAAPEQTLGELVSGSNHIDPITVGPDADVDEVAAALVASRRSSLLVLDDDRRPLGRILADDVVDALAPDTGRRHFPRLLR